MLRSEIVAAAVEAYGNRVKAAAKSGALHPDDAEELELYRWTLQQVGAPRQREQLEARRVVLVERRAWIDSDETPPPSALVSDDQAAG